MTYFNISRIDFLKTTIYNEDNKFYHKNVLWSIDVEIFEESKSMRVRVVSLPLNYKINKKVSFKSSDDNLIDEFNLFIKSIEDDFIRHKQQLIEAFNNIF